MFARRRPKHFLISTTLHSRPIATSLKNLPKIVIRQRFCRCWSRCRRSRHARIKVASLRRQLSLDAPFATPSLDLLERRGSGRRQRISR